MARLALGTPGVGQSALVICNAAAVGQFAPGSEKARRRGQRREDFVLETAFWEAGAVRLLPAAQRPHPRAGLFLAHTHRDPGPGKVLEPRDVCPDTCPDTHLARLLRPGPRPAGQAHGCRRGGGHGLGPARVPALWADSPRRGRGEPADAHGQVAAQEAGERPRNPDVTLTADAVAAPSGKPVLLACIPRPRRSTR